MFALRVFDFNRTIKSIKTTQVIPPLLSKDQIPPELHEVAILGGYRHPKSSVLECVFSVFVATNETFNFWTHFLPVWYFIWKFLTESSVSVEDLSNPYIWPFITYMITVCIYPLISALAHAFHCTSNLARHVWFFLDYSALSMYNFGSALLYRAYIFPTELRSSYFLSVYLYVALINSILCTLSACTSRFTNSLPLKKSLRMVAFGVPYFWTAIPLAYRLVFCGPVDDPLCSDESYSHYLRQFLFCFIAAFMYASHLPERLAPGKFDIVGHSHQLFHICGALATNEQINGVLLDYSRDRTNILSSFWSAWAPILLVSVNLVTIFSFGWCAALHEYKKKSK